MQRKVPLLGLTNNTWNEFDEFVIKAGESNCNGSKTRLLQPLSV